MAYNTIANKRARLNYLDIYKGVLILFVILGHYLWTEEQWLQLLFPFWVDLTVPVFMVISGYVYSISFEQKRFTLSDAYHPRAIICKWLRFVVPFLPILLIQFFASAILKDDGYSLKKLVFLFLKGGRGPGSYYFPIMIQVTIFLPAIYYFINKYRTTGLFCCFLVTVFYEVLKNAIGMSPGVYRLCALRYIFIIAYGCFLYLVHRKDVEVERIVFYIVGLLGYTYILVFNYAGLKPLITNQWTRSSVFASLFIVPIMMHLMKPRELHNGVLELLGKASFNICLVQMCYFWAAADKVYLYVPTIPLRLAVNFIICCTVGVLFYKIENPITRRIVKAIRA